MNYKLKLEMMAHFENASKIAKNIAIEKNLTVEFIFNNIKCLVDKDTNLEWLYRDYGYAKTMDLKIIGPNCLSKTSFNNIIRS